MCYEDNKEGYAKTYVYGHEKDGPSFESSCSEYSQIQPKYSQFDGSGTKDPCRGYCNENLSTESAIVLVKAAY